MHISQVEKYRADKDHAMKNGMTHPMNMNHDKVRSDNEPMADHEMIPQNHFGRGAPT